MKSNCLKSIFDKKNFIYQCLENNPSKTSYLIKFDMKSCITDFIIDMTYNGNKLIFIYAVFPVKIPSHKLNEMAIFIALLNNNLSYGCWELNMGNGVLRFRISYLYEDNEKNFEHHFIENLERAIQYADLCTYALLSIMFTETNPQKVFQTMTQEFNISLN